MTKLKDYLNSDQDTFLNLDEFAQIHNIDGVDIPAVVDNDIVKIRSKDKSEQYDGLYLREIMVYVKAEDLPERPVHGQQIRLDGKLYIVLECSENYGIYEIILGANES